MKQYTNNDIRKLAGQTVMSAMRNHNAYAFRNELTQISSDICIQKLNKESYTEAEMQDIISEIDSEIYDILGH